MRRPSPTPAPAIAPPPRRRASGTASPGTAAPPARPTPPRTPAVTPTRTPKRARRRSVALATLFTLVLLTGYGGYYAYDRVAGSHSGSTAASDGGYVATTESAIDDGRLAIRLGIGLRSLKYQYVFYDEVNATIAEVANSRAHLEDLAARAQPPQSDALQNTIQTMHELEAAIGQWRDVIFNLRLANVESAKSTIESTVAQLEQQIEAWKQLEGS